MSLQQVLSQIGPGMRGYVHTQGSEVNRLNYHFWERPKAPKHAPLSHPVDNHDRGEQTKPINIVQPVSLHVDLESGLGHVVR